MPLHHSILKNQIHLILPYNLLIKLYKIRAKTISNMINKDIFNKNIIKKLIIIIVILIIIIWC